MKRSTYILAFLSFVLIGFNACVEDPDDIFELSATERANEHREACYNALTDAAYGWVVNYFPQPDTYGGYTYLMKFDTNGHVMMTSEAGFGGETDTATFRVHSGQGTVLSFDTYSIFHKLSDPEITYIEDGEEYYLDYGVGYQGDFEFTCQSLDSTQIVFESVKGKSRVVFTRFQNEGDSEAYYTQQDSIQQIVDEMGETGLFLRYQGDSLEVTYDQFHYFSIYSLNELNEYSSVGTPFYVSNTGIVFYDGKNFVWMPEENLFRSEDGYELVAGGSPRARFTNPSSYIIYYVNFEKSGAAFNAAVDSLEDDMIAIVDHPDYFTGVLDIRFIMNAYPSALDYFGGGDRIDVYAGVDFSRVYNLYLVGTTAKSLYNTTFHFAANFSDGDGGTAGYAPFHTLVSNWLYKEIYEDNEFVVEEKTKWVWGEAVSYFQLTRTDNPEFYIVLEAEE